MWSNSSSVAVLVAEPTNKIGDVLRHALIDDVVVHGPQLLADPRLNFPAQTCFGLVGVGSWPGHRILRLRVRRDRLNRLNVGLAVLHVVVFSPFAHLPHPPLKTPPMCANALTAPVVPSRSSLWNFFCVGAFLPVTSALWKGRASVTTSQAVLQHLPSLRRYARALTGSQASGDAYVVATVESLIASPKILEMGPNSRVDLYRLFTKIWNSVAVNGKAEASDVILPPEQHLTQITPRPRQAFLLVALEGFSEEDAAEVLDCDLPTLRALVEESGRELAAEIATDVLIIEDETFIAMDIEALVESLGHNVIGIARTHSEAVALAKQKRPGLILADIQLADGSSGLDAVNELLGSLEVPVIFITAYPERFLTGQRPEPAFLIAKPFQAAVVSAVVSQALFFGRKARQRERKPTERQASL
jgi:DNA-directed RNA polymerase specialized sigma24 family protein/AmiR/NasT family two-component response regulator